jgi:hypothetical protein
VVPFKPGRQVARWARGSGQRDTSGRGRCRLAHSLRHLLGRKAHPMPQRGIAAQPGWPRLQALKPTAGLQPVSLKVLHNRHPLVLKRRALDLGPQLGHPTGRQEMAEVIQQRPFGQTVHASPPCGAVQAPRRITTSGLPPPARRQVWQELNAGYGWIVDADLGQLFDTSNQDKRIDFSAEEISGGRVLRLVRDMRRAGVLEGACGPPTRTGVLQGGDSPLGSNIFLTPFDRRMHAEGFRLTHWADGFIGLCQTKVEAQRALAIAELCFRKALGVARPPQKTRLVHISRGFEFLGYKVKQGTGFRQPTHRRRSWSKPSPPRCCPP